MTLFLLRAYGDFVIAVNMASQNRIVSKITLVASAHLEPLYQSLGIILPDNVVLQFHDFGIRHGIMGCFTDRYLLRISSLTELARLRRYLRTQSTAGHYYLEQKKRSAWVSWYCGYPFEYVVSTEKVYASYARFFSVPMTELTALPFDVQQKGIRVLVIPDARQKRREIGSDIIMKIKAAFEMHGSLVQVARFMKSTTVENGDTGYRNFTELVALIRSADLVIGGDSMPIHVAQLFRKPHYILYPSYVKDQFFTLFALQHQTYFSFEDLYARSSFFPYEN